MKKILALCLVALLSGCARVIEDGQVGVRKFCGHISSEADGPGLAWYIPILGWVEKWDIKTQTIKETADVPSSEGLVSTLDVSVLYNINATDATTVRKTIGQDFETTVIEPYMRQAVRTVVSGYQVKALYSEEGRARMSKEMLAMLREELTPRHINVQDVLLRSVKLPAVFSTSIETKLKTEQEALQKEFELVKANKDAEIMIAKARGTAEANKIIAGSITPEYLRYLWIDAIKGEHNQIIYVPTEAAIPILEAGRGTKAKASP